MKVKYKEQEIDISENVTIEVIDGNLVITPKEYIPFPQNGDICYFNNGLCERILIYNKTISELCIESYVKCDMVGAQLKFGAISSCDCKRYANEEEIETICNSLKLNGKRWNPETKQIEDILKVGDICIFWDDDKSKAVIGVYSELDNYSACPSGFEFVSNIEEEGNNLCFKNSIKCYSLEQYKNFLKQ